MKERIVAVFVALILLFSVYSAWMDLNENHAHEYFFTEVRGFISQGGRNTSSMGKALCERINVLERAKRLPTTDCEAIYGKTE